MSEGRTAQRGRRQPDAQAKPESVHAQLRAELTIARQELEAAHREIDRLRAAPRDGAAVVPSNRAKGAHQRAYDELVAGIAEVALELIPHGARVLVAAKGDDQLLRIGGEVRHFPLAPDGSPAAYHPAGDTAVIAQLDTMRAEGADHLVIPATTLWWLDHYQGLQRHLEERCTELFRDERCAIYHLRRPEQTGTPDAVTAVGRAVASLRSTGRIDPAVLDLHGRLGLRDRLPYTAVFSPPEPGEVLPYLDGSVDIVVVPDGDRGPVEEARRVACTAVVLTDPRFPEVARIEWLGKRAGRWGQNVEITLLPDGDPAPWSTTLEAYRESLDDGFAGSLNVIEPARGTLAQRARAANAKAAGDIQVLVAAPSVPLPGWLAGILSLLERRPDAGLIAPRILTRFGVLDEAGGLVATDGSRHRRGNGDSDPDRPEYRCVKPVEFCSAPLLAVRRELFERLGGLDDSRLDPTEAYTDFSLRAHRSGARVLYQPQARIVTLEAAQW